MQYSTQDIQKGSVGEKGSRSCDVLSRNDLTAHLNNDVSKFSNRDLLRIIPHGIGGKPVVGIAQNFQVTRQRVYQIITQFKESGKYPDNRWTGENLNQSMKVPKG